MAGDGKGGLGDAILGEQPASQVSGTTLGMLIALRAQCDLMRGMLDSLIGAHSPPQAQEPHGGGTQRPATFGHKPSNGG